MSTVLHRFTPPTCTLEIRGKQFSLSFLSKQNLPKFKFELRFEDSLLASKQTVIRGDRQDLEQLKEAVDGYLQKYLQTSFQPSVEVNLAKSQFKNIQPHSQLPGLVNHELYFDFLGGNNNVNRIKLTTIQLLDLVTALEAYREQIATSPKSRPAKDKVFLLLGIVTVTTIIGVGIWQILSGTESASDLDPISREEPTVPITELDEVVPPSTTSAVKPIRPKLTEPLTSAEKLPPPPAVDTPKPKPNIPDPADYPLPDVVRQSRVDIASEPANQEQTESLSAIASKTEEANSPKIPTSETTIIDSDEPDATTPTILVNPEINPKPQIDNYSTGESSQEIAEDNPPNQIAKSSQPSQIKQITTYFQKRWQPPAELKQSLEYRLWLDTDGTIKRVVPLGKAAQLYINETNIPLKGESFIDSGKTQSSIVRLLLSPDGEVQVLSE